MFVEIVHPRNVQKKAEIDHLPLNSEKNHRINQYRKSGFGSFHRPGVYAVTQQRFDDGTVRARLLQSLPDFQGVFGKPQREAVFDCKVCSQASFDLGKYRQETKGARSRQLKFMYERARFGSVCFFLVHWNERRLKTKTVPATTYAIPIHPELEFWRMFEAGEERSLSRSQCDDYGFEAPWITEGLERTPRPDLHTVVLAMTAAVSGQLCEYVESRARRTISRQR